MTREHRRFSVFLVPSTGDFRWADGVIRELAARTVLLDREEMRFDGVKIVVPDPVAGWRDTMRWQTLFRVGLGEKTERIIVYGHIS